MAILKKKLTDILLEAKIITSQDLEKAFKIHADSGGNLKDILVREGFVKEKELMAVFSRELFIPFLELSKYKIDLSIIQLIPEKLARQYKVVPISKIGNVLTVALSDPLNIFAIDDLKVITGSEIDIVLASEKDIVKVLDKFFSSSSATEDISSLVEEEAKGTEVEVVRMDGALELGSVLEESSKAPIVKIVDLSITEALKRRASTFMWNPWKKNCACAIVLMAIFMMFFAYRKRIRMLYWPGSR